MFRRSKSAKTKIKPRNCRQLLSLLFYEELRNRLAMLPEGSTMLEICPDIKLEQIRPIAEIRVILGKGNLWPYIHHGCMNSSYLNSLDVLERRLATSLSRYCPVMSRTEDGITCSDAQCGPNDTIPQISNPYVIPEKILRTLSLAQLRRKETRRAHSRPCAEHSPVGL